VLQNMIDRLHSNHADPATVRAVKADLARWKREHSGDAQR
jgi:hypothetical protein